MTRLSDEALQQLAEAERRMTPGEWGSVHMTNGAHWIGRNPGEKQIHVNKKGRLGDVEGIVLARNALAALVAEVQERRAAEKKQRTPPHCGCNDYTRCILHADVVAPRRSKP